MPRAAVSKELTPHVKAAFPQARFGWTRARDVAFRDDPTSLTNLDEPEDDADDAAALVGGGGGHQSRSMSELQRLPRLSAAADQTLLETDM